MMLQDGKTNAIQDKKLMMFQVAGCREKNMHFLSTTCSGIFLAHNSKVQFI